MADKLDTLLYALAEDADKDVDYDAMYRAIQQKQKRNEKTPLYRARVWGAVAACAVLLVGVSLFSMRGGLRKGDAAPEAASVAMEAAAEAAPEAAMYDVMAEAPMLAAAPAAPAEATITAADAEEPGAVNAAGGVLQARADAGLSNEPYARIVNRENANTLAAAFVPASLVRVAEKALPANLTLKREDEMADAAAADALRAMLEAAHAEGIDGFYLVSAYRTYEEQQSIWEKKLHEDPNYGADGEPVASMPPGSSEHQTGLAFDLTAADHKAMRASFGETIQGAWLRDNCARFGFILRYPKEKEAVTGVEYEPWHFRYVGEDLALYLTENALTLEEGISN